nr:MAG TPA: hypothetical protein [Caudoviricetes sp.]
MTENMKRFLSKDNPSDEEVRNAAEQLIYISAGLRFGAMDLLDSARDQLLLAYISIAERSGDLLSESSESLQDIKTRLSNRLVYWSISVSKKAKMLLNHLRNKGIICIAQKNMPAS